MRDEDIIVRVATKDDAVRVQELRKTGWQDNYVYPEGGVTVELLRDKLAILPPPQEDLDYFVEMIGRPENKSKNLVAVCDGQVEGIVFYDTLDNGNGDIGVFVGRDHRGKGIGKKLLTELIKVSDRPLEVSIFALNKSRGLYKQYGFKEVGEEFKHYFDDSVYLPVQRLVRNV
jgi:phosphinothricin acetyltransferase